jgi:hypothetical protein
MRRFVAWMLTAHGMRNEIRSKQAEKQRRVREEEPIILWHTERVLR